VKSAAVQFSFSQSPNASEYLSPSYAVSDDSGEVKVVVHSGIKAGVMKVVGTVTAGNSSQTSDGAAALVLMSREKAEAMKLKPMATFRSFAVAGVPPEIMGVGPAYAVPKALKKAGLTIKDIGLVELNEAFASQALYVIREL
jgi:acetyl-CoA acyltransferase